MFNSIHTNNCTSRLLTVVGRQHIRTVCTARELLRLKTRQNSVYKLLVTHG